MTDPKEYMKNVARVIDSMLPEGHGFFLLIVPFNRKENDRANYISSVSRETGIKLLRETAYRLERKADAPGATK